MKKANQAFQKFRSGKNRGLGLQRTGCVLFFGSPSSSFPKGDQQDTNRRRGEIGEAGRLVERWHMHLLGPPPALPWCWGAAACCGQGAMGIRRAESLRLKGLCGQRPCGIGETGVLSNAKSFTQLILGVTCFGAEATDIASSFATGGQNKKLTQARCHKPYSHPSPSTGAQQRTLFLCWARRGTATTAAAAGGRLCTPPW